MSIIRTSTVAGIARLPGRLAGARAGFSLTEMMVVLVIMGIILAVAVPNFARFTARDRVETAAYDVQSAFTLARQKALAKRATYRLTFSGHPTTVLVERQDGGSWISDPVEPIVLDPTVSVATLMGGDPTNTDLIVGPQGTVSGEDSPGEITLYNDRADTARVNIVCTGRIRTRVG